MLQLDENSMGSLRSQPSARPGGPFPEAMHLSESSRCRSCGDSDIAMVFLAHLLTETKSGGDFSKEYITAALKALGQLWSRPQWKRIWFVQEVAASQFRAYLCCGNMKINIASLYNAAHRLLWVQKEVVTAEAARNFEFISVLMSIAPSWYVKSEDRLEIVRFMELTADF